MVLFYNSSLILILNSLLNIKVKFKLMNKPLSRRKSQAVISTHQLQRNPSKSSIHKSKTNQRNINKATESDANNRNQQTKRTPQFQRHHLNKLAKEDHNQNVNTMNVPYETRNHAQFKRTSSKSNIHAKNIPKLLQKDKKQPSLIRSKSQGKIVADGIPFKRKTLSPFASQHNTNFISVQSQIRRSNQTVDNQKGSRKNAFNYKSEQIKHCNQPLKKKMKSGSKISGKSQGKNTGEIKKRKQIAEGFSKRNALKQQKDIKKKSFVGVTHNLPAQMLKQIQSKGRTSQIYGLASSKVLNTGSKISTIKGKKQQKNLNKHIEAIKNTGNKSKSKKKQYKKQQAKKQKEYSEISFQQFVANTSHGVQRNQKIKRIRTDFQIEQHFNSHQQLKNQADLYRKLRSNMQNRGIQMGDVLQQQSSSFSSSSFRKDGFDNEKLIRVDKKWMKKQTGQKGQPIQKSQSVDEDEEIEPVTFTNENSSVSQYAQDHIFRVGLSNQNQRNQDQINNQQDSLVTIKDFNNDKDKNQQQKAHYQAKLSLRQYQQESFLIEQNTLEKSEKKQSQSFIDLLQEILQEKTLDQTIKNKIKKALQKQQVCSPKVVKQPFLQRKLQKSPNLVCKQSQSKEESKKVDLINEQKHKQQLQKLNNQKENFKGGNKRISLQIQIVKPGCDQSPIKTVMSINQDDWLVKSEKKKEYVQKKVEAEISSQKVFNSPRLNANDFQQFKSPLNKNRQFQSPKHFNSPRQFKERNQKSCSPLNIQKQFFFFKEEGSLQKPQRSSEKNQKIGQKFNCQSPKKLNKVEDYLNTAQQQLKSCQVNKREQFQYSSQKRINLKTDPGFPQMNVTSQFIENLIVLVFRYLKSSCSINQIDERDYIEYPLIFNFLEKLNNFRYYQESLNTRLISRLLRQKYEKGQLLDRAVQQFMFESKQYPDSIFPQLIINSLIQNQEVISLLKNQGFGHFLQEPNQHKRQQMIENSFLCLILDALSEAAYRQFLKYPAYFSKIQESINVQKLSEFLVIRSSKDANFSQPTYLQVPKQASDFFVKIFLLVIPMIKDWSQRLAGTTYQEYWNQVQLRNKIDQLNKKAYDKMGIQHNQDIDDDRQSKKLSDLMLSLIAQQIYRYQLERVAKELLQIKYDQ